MISVLPMTDAAVAPWVETDEGLLSFQCYFVERRCAPRVLGLRFVGAEQAGPAPGVIEAIAGAAVVLIAPSNPWLSIDPITTSEDRTRVARAALALARDCASV